MQEGCRVGPPKSDRHSTGLGQSGMENKTPHAQTALLTIESNIHIFHLA